MGRSTASPNQETPDASGMRLCQSTRGFSAYLDIRQPIFKVPSVALRLVGLLKSGAQL